MDISLFKNKGAIVDFEDAGSGKIKALVSKGVSIIFPITRSGIVDFVYKIGRCRITMTPTARRKLYSVVHSKSDT